MDIRTTSSPLSSSSASPPPPNHRMSSASSESGPVIPAIFANKNEQLVSCKVCNIPTQNKIRCGVIACEACKKFFLRNFANGDSLRCVYGTSDCSTATGRAVLTSSGAILRLSCPRCRLAKCFSVGMRVSEKIAQLRMKQHSSNQSGSDEPDRPSPSGEGPGEMQLTRPFGMNPDLAPTNLRRFSDEEVLNKAVKAATDLSIRFQGLPLMSSFGNFDNEGNAWRSTMNHLESAFRQVTSFGNQLPGFADLPAEDRCQLIGNAMVPLSAVQPYDSALALNSLNEVNMLRHFPEFSAVLESGKAVTPTVKNWKPSQAEYSLLLALLFYQDNPNLSNSSGVREVADQLRGVYQAVVTQQFPSEPAAVDSRVGQLSHVLDMVVSETPTKRKEAFDALKTRRPGLISQAPLYSKIHQPPAAPAKGTTSDNNRHDESRNAQSPVIDVD